MFIFSANHCKSSKLVVQFHLNVVARHCKEFPGKCTMLPELSNGKCCCACINRNRWPEISVGWVTQPGAPVCRGHVQGVQLDYGYYQQLGSWQWRKRCRQHHLRGHAAAALRDSAQAAVVTRPEQVTQLNKRRRYFEFLIWLHTNIPNYVRKSPQTSP